MEFETTLRGEPVVVVITEYQPAQRGNSSGHPDTWYPEEDSYIDFEVFSEAGELVLLTREECEEIELEAYDFLEEKWS
jgi:hypothetical protein